MGPLQGLKPNIDLIGFIGPTEVVPLLQSLCSGHAREFFRKVLSRSRFAAQSARLKSCPDTSCLLRRIFEKL